MGHARSPLPYDGGVNHPLVDDGTLARIDSPDPSPIGLDTRPGPAKGGGGKQGASMADRIVSYASLRLGERVGDGECFTLVDRALRSAGAKSAADYGEVTPDADYVWGSAVGLSDLRPGDVIQFRDYRFERTVETTNSEGTTTTTENEERPHHTAIVEAVDGSVATVLEQNAPEGSPVRRIRLYFDNVHDSSGDTTVDVTVSGTWWFYRAEAP
jgi:hypothetical protein